MGARVRCGAVRGGAGRGGRASRIGFPSISPVSGEAGSLPSCSCEYGSGSGVGYTRQCLQPASCHRKRYESRGCNPGCSPSYPGCDPQCASTCSIKTSWSSVCAGTA